MSTASSTQEHDTPVFVISKTAPTVQGVALRVFLVFSLTTISILFGTVAVMVSYGWEFLIDARQMIEIITTNNWFPSDTPGEGHYGAAAFIYGTFAVGIPALLMAIFWGVGSAILLSEFVPSQISRKIQTLLEFIASVPSVIYGMIAFVYISEFVRTVFNTTSGRVILTGSITLGFMAAPIIASISYDAMQSTPRDLRLAAKSMGATRWNIFRTVVFPHSRNSILASIMLGFGRVLGETMVVLMVIGNSPQIKWTLLATGYTLTSGIANEIGDASFNSPEFKVIFILALILLLISFIVTGVSTMFIYGSTMAEKIASALSPWLTRLVSAVKGLLPKRDKRVEITIELASKSLRRRSLMEGIVAIALSVTTSFYVLTVISLLGVLFFNGYRGINLTFLTTSPTFTNMIQGQYGVLSASIGSVLLALVASLLAFPIATITGIYLNEFAPENRLTNSIKLAIVNISSLPSIVVGLFVYGFFSIALDWKQGLLPGGIALGIMMIPIVTTNTIEALNNVTPYHRTSALALGATDLQALTMHKLPYAMPNIVTGYILAIGRVIGETAPLLFTAAAFVFGADLFPNSLIREPIRVLTYEVYYNLLFGTFKAASQWALSIGIVLIAILVILNAMAYGVRRLIRMRYEYNGAI